MYSNVYLLNLLFLSNGGSVVIKTTFIHSFTHSTFIEPLAPEIEAVKHTVNFRSSLFHREDKLIETRKTKLCDTKS